ncbi:MAG: hypothetical protein VX610_05745 [SAR324 cluster bacterium]|nr:hypothetical protein [SAR324 cluster bacterium]
MLRILGFSLLTVLLAAFGYFSTINNQKVEVQLYGPVSIQVALWVLVLGTLVLGWLLTELYLMIRHPDRWFFRLRGGWQARREAKEHQRLSEFQAAYLSHDLDTARKAFKRIQGDAPPMSAVLQSLALQRYALDGDALKEEYAKLRELHPQDLEVLMPYLRAALEWEDWDLAGQLGRELDRLQPGHPVALEGLRQVAIAQGEWMVCLEQERALMERFPQSIVVENLTEAHLVHLRQAFRTMPKRLENWKLNYLPKRDKALQALFEVFGEAAKLHGAGESFQAAKRLKKGFEKTGAPDLLEELEHLYHASEASEGILELIGDIYNTKYRTPLLRLIYAKLLYQSGRYADAAQILADTDEDEAKDESVVQLKFLVAMRQENAKEALSAAAQLLPEQTLLPNGREAVALPKPDDASST